MNKQEKIALVMNAVTKFGRPYTILDGNYKSAKHIRIEGWGDIWPTTGTFKKGKKFTRKNIPLLLKELGSDYTPKQKKPKVDIQALAKRLTELEEYVAHLEYRIENPSYDLN